MESVKDALRRYPGLATPLRLVRYNAWRTTGLGALTSQWPELGQLSTIVKRSAAADLAARGTHPRILFFTFRSWANHTVWDTLLGQALRMRGADVQFFTCGGRLPICDIAAHTQAPPMPCDSCAPYIAHDLSALDLPSHELRDFISTAERSAIRREVAALAPEAYPLFEFAGLPVGQLVRPSVQWFLLSGSLGDDAASRQVYQQFLVSGAIMACVANRLLDTLKPDKLYVLNGLFFAERILLEAARQRDIPFITHEAGFLPDTQVFSHNDFAPYYPIDEAWAEYAQHPLTASEEQRLDEYLARRTRGNTDVVAYYPTIAADQQAIRQQLGLDPDKTIVTLFTNVDWDTACFARPSAFPTMHDWINATIQHFVARTDAHLIIRVHPAEVRLPFLEPRHKVQEMITQRFGSLPPHIHLIPPESDLSSYALMAMSALGLVYTSTTGMEMALQGKPVLTAGRGYYAGKGFTFDAETPADYFSWLERLPTLGALSPDMIALARRYACLFFFRHHLPFPLVTTTGGQIQFNFETLSALAPGREPALDLLCDAILNDTPFLYQGSV